MGLALSLIQRRPAQQTVLALVLAGPVIAGAAAMAVSPGERGSGMPSGSRLLALREVGEWFEDNRRPGETILAYCSGASLYGNVSTDPPYPYLWSDGVLNIPGARRQLVDLLAGPTPPSFVVMVQAAEYCDETGVVARVLDERYETATIIRSRKVLRLRADTGQGQAPPNERAS